jgi:hypothetical protein
MLWSLFQMLTPLGLQQVTASGCSHSINLFHSESMLAVAHPKDDNWNKQSSPMSRTPQSVAKTTSSGSLASPLPSKESHSQYQVSSTAMSSNASGNGTIVPPSSTNGPPSSAKPLVRSKSRGSSVGGFVHGLVNGVQASLRNVGHKTVPSGVYLTSLVRVNPFSYFPRHFLIILIQFAPFDFAYDPLRFQRNTSN